MNDDRADISRILKSAIRVGEDVARVSISRWLRKMQDNPTPIELAKRIEAGEDVEE